MTNLHTPGKEWLAETFEYEYCAECGGDDCHHTAIPFLGNWFARCDYPPDDQGHVHNVVLIYRSKQG